MYTPAVTEPLPLSTRLWFSYACFFRVLFDGGFAARVRELGHTAPALPVPSTPPPAAPQKPPSAGPEPALQLLALLQREGRLVDFLEQDITGFGDTDVAAAGRVVHEGCRRALHSQARIVPIRAEPEGTRVQLGDAYDSRAVKLTGNVAGSAPYQGVLRHRGWRVESIQLPEAIAEHDATVLAPAEVEL